MTIGKLQEGELHQKWTGCVIKTVAGNTKQEV